MSNLPANSSILNNCGCCEGQEARSPVELYNRPGLSAIAYRTGAYNDFRASMQARLSVSDQEPLAGLTTRDDDDFSIALLDAWAVVSDVLTFYQERFINESYLRTATERLSILEQARLIGYELSPGVAASTYLAFSLEDPPGAPDQAVKQIAIETGVKVQSTPGPDEDPQMYETVEQIEARVEWNEIRPRLYQPQDLSETMTSIVFEGTDTGVKQGDTLLIKTGSIAIQQINKVTPDDKNETTRVDLEGTPALSPSSYTESCSTGDTGSMDDLMDVVEPELSDTIEKLKDAGCWKVEDIAALAKIQKWDLDTIVENINTLIATTNVNDDEGVFAFRQQAAVFGCIAPKQVTYSISYPYLPKPANEWDEWKPNGEADDRIFLDNDYDKIIPNSYVIIDKPGADPASFEITSISRYPRTAYGISGRTTAIILKTNWWTPDSTDSVDFDYIRRTNVLAQSEKLTVAQVPIEDEVEGDTLTLDGAYLYLRAGQKAILTGERLDLEGITESEVVTLKEVLLDNGFTVLVFKNDLKYSYIRISVTINANVALATHGETVTELLGSGDAGQANQKFVLKQAPMTYVSAATAGGVKSTLEVRVDNILWEEVPSLYGRDSAEHIYTTFMDDDGKVTVQFGDGINGARLTSGQNNVRATYRKGIGLGGLVKARQLDQLMTRPLGLKAAINPLPPNGAADPEQLADARDNAPLTVLTLDRTVSLQDYEDFSRAFAGIAKSLAIERWDGGKRRILITVAAPKGASVVVDSKLHTDLSNALLKAGDPLVYFRVLSYRSALFRIDGNIVVDPAYDEEEVLDDTKLQLREAFSFARRDFGQPVMLSEVIAVIQDVPGVIAVDIDRLYRADESESIPPDTRLNAALPEKDSTTGEMLGAELLVLDSAPLTHLGVKS